MEADRLYDVPDRMARAVSVGETPARAAAWIEGFLSGNGLVLVHDDPLLRLVDGWIGGLTDQAFTDVLPCCAAPSPSTPPRSAALSANGSGTSTDPPLRPVPAKRRPLTSTGPRRPPKPS